MDFGLFILNHAIPKIYPITDVAISCVSHAEQVARLIAGGATLIQLRDKDASPRDFYDAAAEAIAIARPHGVKVIINDRVDIAFALKTDGVHLGQDDMPPVMARSVLGENAIIGFSTHSVEQAHAAVRQPVDYIAFGPIFITHTKSDHEPVVGLNGLREIRKIVGDFPLVAIGGINDVDLSSVFDAGADSAAVIGAVLSDQAKIESRMRELVRQAPNFVKTS